MPARVIIVDYGMGNLWSVYNALRHLGVDPVVTGEPAQLGGADALILPGVGSFRKAMLELDRRGLSDALTEAVVGRKRKILGICLGMQLFAERGTEDGDCQGLGFMTGTVERFTIKELGALKVPHIGFNEVMAPPQSRLFRAITTPVDLYFVHSYRLLADARPGVAGRCCYGIEFLAAYEHENVFAAQFHPEKSQTNGLRLLNNFLCA